MQVSHGREVGFSRSGNMMYVKVSGKQGGKIYLYNTINNYELLEVLSSNKPIESVRFSSFDNLIYGIHQNGYYTWSLDSLFKHRMENTMEIPFVIKGGDIYMSNLLLWGENDIMLIDQGEQ